MPLRLSLLIAFALVLAGTRADEKKPLSRIAFGSCVHQDKEQPVWEAIAKQRPELLLMLGDNIYADTQDIEAMRAKYAKLAAQPGYRRLREACPMMATWDDHDFGGEDAGSEYPKKKESQEAFLDFFQVPKDAAIRKQEGIYTSAVYGPEGKRVQVILLDTRYHRSPLKKDLKLPRNKGQYVPNTDDGATMLGEAQWRWLDGELRKPAEVRLLCSSVQVIAEDHGFEKWMNLPRERARLYRLIRDAKAGGVIVLSGDRHLAELSAMDAGVGYTLYDLTSSGLNQANRRFRPLEVNRHRVATMDRGNNFGVVRIDWDKKDPQITLEIRDEDGDVTIGHKLPLSQLQPRGRRAGLDGAEDLAAAARTREGKEWAVELVVQSTGQSRDKGRIYLNSEADFRSERNLTIVLDTKSLARDLKEARVKDPRKHFGGKKVKVTGKVTIFRDNPQIEVTRLSQIQVVGE
ncbi:MAG: alkaline phosphatase D family protein [Gemmataceae bacterium]